MIKKSSGTTLATLTLALTSVSGLPAAAQVVSSILGSSFGSSFAIAADTTNHMVYMLAIPLNNDHNPPGHRPPPPPPNGQQSGVIIFDPKSGAFSSIPGINPRIIAVNNTANTIYVGNISSPAGNGAPALPSSLTIINGADNSYTSLGIGTPNAIAVDEVANKVYVSIADSNNDLVVIDGKSKTISATVPMPVLLSELAVDSGLGKVYGCANGGSDLLSVKVATSAITSIPTGGLYTIALAVDSQTHRAYVVDNNHDGGTSSLGIIAAINTTTDRRVAIRSVGVNPTAVALNPNTKTVYVLNTTDPAFPLDPNFPGVLGPSMTVLDEATLTLLRPHGVPLVGAANSLAINPVTNKIYIPFLNGTTQTMTVVDGNTNLPAAVYAGPGPFQLALNPGVNQAYLLSSPSAATSVIVLDLTGGSAAVPTIFPATLKFSSPVGHPSQPRTVYLANTGGVAMDVSQFTFNDRLIRQKNDCPGVLDPGAVCPIELRFTPHAPTPTYVTDTFQAAISTGATAATSIAADVPPLLTTLVLSGSDTYNGQLIVYGTLTSADPDLTPYGVTVTATLNGVTASSAASDGTFTISFDPSSLVPGQTYPVTLSSAGNATYLPSTATGSITP